MIQGKIIMKLSKDLYIYFISLVASLIITTLACSLVCSILRNHIAEIFQAVLIIDDLVKSFCPI